MATFRDIWKIQTVDQKSDFMNALGNKFPEISLVTALNWGRQIAPTTPNANICEWVAKYFKSKPSTVFPSYYKKVEMRKNKELKTTAFAQR